MKNRLVLLMICMLLVLPKVEIIAEESSIEEVSVEVNEYTSSPINPRLIATNTPNADGFVVRLYRLCLNREADQNGFMHWHNRILNKKESGTSLVLKFFNSNEYLQRNTSDSDFVESLYQIALNRKAEPKGKIYWLNQITSYSREDIIKQFCVSNEFKGICQRYNIVLEIEDPIASFVKRMYEKTLMRSASASEIEGWRNPLAQKQKTAANLIEAFFFSAELQKQNISKEEFVRRAYATLLNRAARNDEVQYWVGKLNDGSSQKQVLYGFVEGKEFKNLCAQYGIDKGSIVLDPKEIKQTPIPITYYAQGDARWGGRVYGAWTMASTGCMPTSLAMVLTGSLGRSVSPIEVANYAYYNTSTFNRLFLGMSSEGLSIVLRNYGMQVYPIYSIAELNRYLEKGYAVLANMNPGTFSPAGYTHCIVLNGYNNGQTNVYDPLNAGRNGSYSTSFIFNQKSTDRIDIYQGAAFFATHK